MDKKNLKIVFFGTPEFAVESLDALVTDGFEISAVVTMPDKKAGRGHKMIESPVKTYAVAHGLEVLQPEKLKSPEFVERLHELNADLFIVIAFRMLPEVVWSMPRLGTFNLHASLLPRYRGAAPINRAIMNGETETGITTFFLKHEIDTGDMIMQERIAIGPDDDVETIHDRLMELGAKMVVKTVNDILNDKVSPMPQPEGEFIPAPKIFKEDCRIDWNSNSETVRNHVRGLSPYPGAFTTIVDKNGNEFDVKIFHTHHPENLDLPAIAEPGEILISGNCLLAACADGWLEIDSLQPAGKKRMETDAFLRGYFPVKMK